MCIVLFGLIGEFYFLKLLIWWGYANTEDNGHHDLRRVVNLKCLFSGIIYTDILLSIFSMLFSKLVTGEETRENAAIIYSAEWLYKTNQLTSFAFLDA